MLRLLFLLFIVLPIAELAVLVQLGRRFGVLETVAIVLLVGVVGASLAKREGLRVFGEYQRSVAEGTVPPDGVLSGLLVLVASGLFVLPGVISDGLALVLLFPPTRRLVAKLLRAWLASNVAQGSIHVTSVDARGFGGMSGMAGHGGMDPNQPRSVEELFGGRSPRPPADVIDVVGVDVTTDEDASERRPRLPPST